MSIALLLTVLTAASEPQTDEEKDRHVSEAFPARLSAKNPWFELPEGRTTEISVSIDGREAGRCKESPREKSSTCFEGVTLAPGSHVLTLGFTVKDKRTLAPLSFSGSELFVAGPHEEITLDLQKSVTPNSKPEQYLSRKTTHAHPSSCLAAMEAVASAPACTTAEVEKIPGLVDAARSACSAGASSEPWTRLLAYTALLNVTAIEPRQCLDPDVLEKLPSRLSNPYAGRSAWPEGTLETSSWAWARELPDDANPRDADALTLLERLKRHVLEVRDRVKLVEESIEAHAKPSERTKYLRRTLEVPFSFDPRVLNGHRWFLAASQAERDRSPEPKFIEALAAKLANDPSVHCGMRAEQDVVIPLFLKDDKLSAAEWKAVTGMLRRTPEDAKVRRCDHAAAASVQSEVPFAERLKTLADFDCAPTRHEQLRGDLVRSVIGLQMDEQAKKTADQLKAKFVGCLEK